MQAETATKRDKPSRERVCESESGIPPHEERGSPRGAEGDHALALEALGEVLRADEPPPF